MKFKIGDPVRIIASPGRHFDKVGTVTDVDRGAFHPFRVDVEDAPLWFGPHELVLAEHQPSNDERPAA